jgi:molybdopterin molybdotransferase
MDGSGVNKPTWPKIRLAGSQASSRIGSLQGADLLLEIPAALGAGTELGAQPLRLPIS